MPESVRDIDELQIGLNNFWEGATPAHSLHAKFQDLLKRGKNFVCSADGTRMAPSRFVGYTGNTLFGHSKLERINGGVTDPAITRILGDKNADELMDSAYLKLCEGFGIEPKKNRRAFWVLPGELSQEARGKDADSMPLLDTINAKFEDDVEEARRLDPAARQSRLFEAERKPQTRKATVTVFVRNPDVVAEVLFRAGGDCEGCLAPAPFRRSSDDSPYLEVHHKVRLADGGDDTVENAMALCPNCHREKHFG